MAQRTAATLRLEQRLSGLGAAHVQGSPRPTDFQARRLSMLLAILDALQADRRRRVTTHEIASQVIYPRLMLGRGAQWKGSSERRRTQRLIEEALSMMRGGYRRLLRAGLGGATKTRGSR